MHWIGSSGSSSSTVWAAEAAVHWRRLMAGSGECNQQLLVPGFGPCLLHLHPTQGHSMLHATPPPRARLNKISVSSAVTLMICAAVCAYTARSSMKHKLMPSAAESLHAAFSAKLHSHIACSHQIVSSGGKHCLPNQASAAVGDAGGRGGRLHDWQCHHGTMCCACISQCL